MYFSSLFGALSPSDHAALGSPVNNSFTRSVFEPLYLPEIVGFDVGGRGTEGTREGLTDVVSHPVKTDTHNENASKAMKVDFISATIPPTQAGAMVKG
mgnify:CR=1 FL=1